MRLSASARTLREHTARVLQAHSASTGGGRAPALASVPLASVDLNRSALQLPQLPAYTHGVATAAFKPREAVHASERQRQLSREQELRARSLAALAVPLPPPLPRR